jgi:hypothetical protein
VLHAALLDPSTGAQLPLDRIDAVVSDLFEEDIPRSSRAANASASRSLGRSRSALL